MYYVKKEIVAAEANKEANNPTWLPFQAIEMWRIMQITQHVRIEGT